MEMYRCKGCGYLHVGPAPERCPVCGAPQSFFNAYDGPGDLTGTRTLENLMSAFAGESQAYQRYTLFARIAGLEGRNGAKKAFERALTEEAAHALGNLAYAGGFGSTDDNLTAAVAGEEHETVDMYPAFAEIAEEEGYPQIAQYFRALGGYERQHRDAYKKVLDSGE
ncbi:MAG: rubrerythrin [Coriobacteriia bacterium]|nr:rubrerythrin [Coriobacteriia bacterium]MBN2841059.1 rubrerythrin [Coriobacteriia bacterium]